jgi:hypothetical protein
MNPTLLLLPQGHFGGAAFRYYELHILATDVIIPIFGDDPALARSSDFSEPFTMRGVSSPEDSHDPMRKSH